VCLRKRSPKSTFINPNQASTGLLRLPHLPHPTMARHSPASPPCPALAITPAQPRRTPSRNKRRRRAPSRGPQSCAEKRCAELDDRAATPSMTRPWHVSSARSAKRYRHPILPAWFKLSRGPMLLGIYRHRPTPLRRRGVHLSQSSDPWVGLARGAPARNPTSSLCSSCLILTTQLAQ
jgi:hypothetical protein